MTELTAMLRRVQALAACTGVALTLLAIANAARAQEELPREVATALREAGIPAASVGIAVRQADTGAGLLSVNSGRPLNPASVMKLVTTYAGLELLGPAYEWKTEVYTAGTRSDGRLVGHLILKGYGDPKLTLENFWLLLRGIRERGVRDIEGDVMIDQSRFDVGNHDPAKFDAEPLRPYNVGPSALLINYKALRFHFVPEERNAAVRLIPEPRLRGLDVINAVKPGKGRCGDWRRTLQADFLAAPQGGSRLVFSGAYPVECGERTWNMAPFGHREYVAGLFGALWEEMGGRWEGKAHYGSLPSGATLLYTHHSPPLAQVVRDINKFSNNVMARQLYLTIGADLRGAPGSTGAAFEIVRGWIAAKSIQMPGLAIENGSGLSRIERVTADGMTRLLVAAFNSAVMPEFIASMPVVAVDGTMRRRLKGDSVAGQAHIKTGSLAGVRSIAGYVLARDGRRYVVAMMVNDAEAARAQRAMDELLRWVYDRG